MNKLKITIITGMLSNIINMIIAIKPELADNQIIKDIEAAVAGLHELGL